MAAQNVCSYFKFGYCKHREYCRKQHVKDTCENKECDISNCNLRHPKICKFYRDYNYCKFDPCMFRHVEKEDNSQIKMLKMKTEAILKNISDIEISIQNLDNKILKSEEIIAKLAEFEKKVERMDVIEKHINDKDSEIKTLIDRVNVVENKMTEKDDIIAKLNEKLNLLIDDEEIEDELEEVSEIEKTFCNPNDILKRCPHCSFETYIKDDLVNHMKTNHEKKLKCDYCDFIGKTSSGLKAHMTKKHTIVKKFKCFTCDFSCETHSELVTHSDIYWYSHRQCLDRNHEKYILGEYSQLKEDGFVVHRKLDW